MTHLVTGCAGFIGSHVAAALLDRGEPVVGVDDLNARYDPTLKEWRLERLRATEGFTFHRADIAHRDAVDDLFEDHDVDAALNLAAYAGVRQSVEDPWTYLQANAAGTLNLLEACRGHDVPTLALASTSSLYGRHNDVPFAEDADTDVPPSPYAASKKAAEALAATYADLYGLNCPVLRYFTVYGPAGRPDMSVFRFIRWIVEGEPVRIYGDGTQSRDFTYVDDVVRGTLLAAETVEGFEVLNLGNDSPVELMDLVRIIEKHVGKEAKVVHEERHPADMDATWADISKAKRMLGWVPEVGLDEGVGRAVEWYVVERGWASKVDLGAV